MRRRICFEALPGIPEIQPGDDLASLIVAALEANTLNLSADSILVVAQKIVSKSEGRFAWMDEVKPSAKALELAAITGKDPALVELPLSESDRVLRAVPGVMIVRHLLGYVMIVRHLLGYVMANAGIDMSNVPGKDGRERALLLPLDADASALALRGAVHALTGQALGVVISDSFGRTLQVTQTAFADAIAAGAALAMGEGDEGMPVVLASGFMPDAPVVDCKALLRPIESDLFQ